MSDQDRRRQRVLVLGGGFGGMYCARRVARRLPPDEAEVVLLNAHNYMLYTPLLPEAAAGTIEPRHVVVPLRLAIPRVKLRVGELRSMDLERRTCTYATADGVERTLDWDRLVVALGSVSRVFPIPGLAEHGHGFKTLAEGIYLRNHVLEQLELADAASDPEERLTFVVVGAGYAGTELIAELRSLVHRALRLYPGLRPEGTRWILADVAPRVLPELGGRLSSKALEVLRRRGIEIRLRTTLEEVGPDWVRFKTVAPGDDRSAGGGQAGPESPGDWVPTSTVVWTAGVTPDPLAGKLGLPTDERGRILVDEHLRVKGHPEVFALGDVAAVPIAGRDAQTAPPTAQHALREAWVCGDNVAASLGHGRVRRFRFKGLGLLVNLSDHYGVGRAFGVPISGLLGWFVTRSYHLAMLPTWSRRLRVGLDWFVAIWFPRDTAELGTLGHPEPLPGEHGTA